MVKDEEIPFVCVWMCTYNHNEFITQAIEGVLAQKTNYSIKLIISDDYSTDGTREICIKYKEEYSDIIELILPEKNTDCLVTINELYPACFNSGAKYIAMCEGDDYWTDPYKLQKQVDILDANPDISICHHRVQVVYEKDQSKNHLSHISSQKKISTIEDVFDKSSYPLTGAMLFRNQYQALPSFFTQTKSGDYALNIWNASFGDIYFIDEVMSVYRIHDSGITRVWAKDRALSLDYLINEKLERIDFLDTINDYFEFKYNIKIQKEIHNLYNQILLKLIESKQLFQAIKLCCGCVTKRRSILSLKMTIYSFRLIKKSFSKGDGI